MKKQVFEGMKPFKKLFVRAMTEDDVARLLDLRIRRISAYDIKKNRGEITDIVAAIRQCNAKLKNLTKTTIGWLSGLVEKYRDLFPRRTVVETFHTVDKVAVAKANIRLSYDREAGYFGSSMRGSEFVMNVTEYDRILTVTSDGTYRIMAPPDKAWMPGALLYAAVWDPGKGEHFVLVYRDAAKVAWGKRVHIERFITNKTYSLVKEGSVGIDFLSEKKNPGRAAAQHGAIQASEGEGGQRGPGQDPGVRPCRAGSEALRQTGGKRSAPARARKNRRGPKRNRAPRRIRYELRRCRIPAAAMTGVCRTRSFSRRLNAILGACSSGLALRVILSPVAGLIPTRAFRAGRFLRDSRPIFPSGTRRPRRRPDSSIM